VYASGRRLVNVSHTSDNGGSSREIVDAIVAEFRERTTETVTRNVESARAIYTEQLEEELAVADAAEDELLAYLAGRPAGTTVVNDAQAAALSKTMEDAQKQYRSTQDFLASLELQYRATLEGQDNVLRVEDPASVPATPTTTSKRELLAMPIAGFMLALSLSAAMYAFLLRTDNSIRTAHDVEAFSGLALLGTVPDVGGMKKRHWPKHFFRMAVAGLGATGQR
jgi:capsular polysaccharide biosynthesis protein